jgi:Ca2+-binding EF-hand superfamily protein
MRVFARGWNWIDIGVVFVSVVGETVATLYEQFGRGMFGIFRVARILRLVRFVRAAKIIGRVKELRKLVQMAVSCFRTLFWSFCLTFVVMTVWAHMAVVLIQPLVDDLAKKGQWDDCEECLRSFTSVMRANLTLFQTIVASDSWGKVAVPVIEAHPWTAFVFVGAWLTLIFGMLNLIVAAMVDAFAEARENDVRSRAQERTEEEEKEKDALSRIFTKIDYDCSGYVSFARLKMAAETVPEFRQRLRVMDVGVPDLQQLFRMIDEDHSGVIEEPEFIEVLYRLKQTDSKVVTVFLKHYVQDLGKKQKSTDRKVREMDANMSRMFDYMMEAEVSLKAGREVREKLEKPAPPPRASTLSSSILSSSLSSGGEGVSWGSEEAEPASNNADSDATRAGKGKAGQNENDAANTEVCIEANSTFSSPRSVREGSYQLVTHRTVPRMHGSIVV